MGYVLAFKKKAVVHEYTPDDFNLIGILPPKEGVSNYVYEFEISGITDLWASPANGVYSLLYRPQCYYDAAGYPNHTVNNMKFPTDTEYYQSLDSPYDYENPITIIPLPKRYVTATRKPGGITKDDFYGQPGYTYSMVNSSFYFNYAQHPDASEKSYSAFMNITPEYRALEKVEIPGQSYTQTGAWTQFPWGNCRKSITGWDDNDNNRQEITEFNITLLDRCKLII